MPHGGIYRFRCVADASHPFEQFAWDGDPVACPVCGSLSHRVMDSGNAEAAEYLSDALGVHPTQIDEAKRLFPHHNFAPDGRMVVKNYQDRKRILKDLGMKDWDGVSG